MNSNIVIKVNEKDEVLGYMEKMEAHQKGVLHRAISVLVFNSKKEWLLQQRTEKKYHSGLLWSNTSCTHPMKDESTISAAERRLEEEMGMKTPLKKLFSFQYKAILDNDLIENELDHVFIGYSDELPLINKEEVCAYRFVSTEKLKLEMKQDPDSFSEWFKILFKKMTKDFSLCY